MVSPKAVHRNRRSLMKLVSIIAAGLVVALGAPLGVHAQTISPGKNVAYTFLTNLSMGTSYSSVAQVSFIKGKKKRTLEVDVKILDRQLTADALGAYVTVNGVEMHPGSADAPQITHCDHAWINCTLTSHFWADLDALELANPGMFKNQPLLVDVQGIAGANPTSFATVSVRARMVKK
jgi:hypothetical protein